MSTGRVAAGPHATVSVPANMQPYFDSTQNTRFADFSLDVVPENLSLWCPGKPCLFSMPATNPQPPHEPAPSACSTTGSVTGARQTRRLPVKRWFPALLSLTLAAPLAASAAEQLIPAGSLIQCTISEPRLSSKTADIGDPVLCQVSHVELYGRSTLPYGSYLEGRFEDYRDPGHFVGKGWMQLKFDRLIIEPDTVIPLDAKVVDVPGYNVDRHGRILGKGHAVRDIVEWSIPILWPIDLLNLPRRGPRPTLKEETRLTLKIMDDFGVPMNNEPAPVRDDSGLLRRAPTAYEQPPAPPLLLDDAYARRVVPVVLPPPPVLLPPRFRPYYVPAPAQGWPGGPRVVTIWRNGFAYRTIIP